MSNVVPGDSKRVTYRKPGFLENVVALHRVMFRSNNGLTSSHPYDSRPTDWPFLYRGISFWRRKGVDTLGIYLIGNPLVWWWGSTSIVLFGMYTIVTILASKRQYELQQNKDLMYSLWTHSIAYLCHYLPFFLMKRQVHSNNLVIFASLFTIIVLFYPSRCWSGRRHCTRNKSESSLSICIIDTNHLYIL
jgi:dolichyl-phosphate-mannose-protein mannosyltransferase